jgi:glycogen synthase
MKPERIIVSGDRQFIARHRALFELMTSQYSQLDYVYGDELFETPFFNKLVKVFKKFVYIAFPAKFGSLQSPAQGFGARSKRTEGRIRNLRNQPDFVLHLFGMYSPFWDKYDIPYGMYLDYTAALAHRKLHPAEGLADWKDCERVAYERAYHLFTMSRLVKSSLVNDYGIAPEKITVVGSFASHHTVYEGEKKFGSQQILFNGADFERKGGDLVLEAFKYVKKALPGAKLVIIGKKLTVSQEGIDNPGKIKSSAEMRQLFLETDLVIAPGRCDPFPTFVIEAMNYGVPCIVSGNDGMPEIVDCDVNGLVVDPLTPELIAEKAIDLLGNISTLTSMSQQARQKVQLQLNRNSVAEKIMQVLANDGNLAN